MKKQNYLIRLLIICFVLVGVLSSISAQEGNLIEPLDLSSEPIILEFSTSAAGPPTIEPLSDGRMTFRITVAGPVTGAIEGTMSGQVTEVTPNPSPPFHPVSILFTIETEAGEITGYYAGSFHLPDGADLASVSASGRILSVSGAYADLYLAEVIVSSTVQFEDGRSVGDSGTITISVR